MADIVDIKSFSAGTRQSAFPPSQCRFEIVTASKTYVLAVENFSEKVNGVGWGGAVWCGAMR